MDDDPSTTGCNFDLRFYEGLGTRDRALIGIVCARTPSQIYEIKQAYYAMYHQTLERQIEGDTSGDYRRVSFHVKICEWFCIGLFCWCEFRGLQLLLALVRGNRSESIAVDPNYALADAHALYNAGVARLGTDENAFIQILATRSPAHLNMTLQYYRQTYGHDFQKVDYCTICGCSNQGLFLALSNSFMFATGCKEGDVWTFWRCTYSGCSMHLLSCQIFCRGMLFAIKSILIHDVVVLSYMQLFPIRFSVKNRYTIQTFVV